MRWSDLSVVKRYRKWYCTAYQYLNITVSHLVGVELFIAYFVWFYPHLKEPVVFIDMAYFCVVALHGIHFFASRLSFISDFEPIWTDLKSRGVDSKRISNALHNLFKYENDFKIYSERMKRFKPILDSCLKRLDKLSDEEIGIIIGKQLARMQIEVELND